MKLIVCSKCEKPYLGDKEFCPHCPEPYFWDQESLANIGCLLLTIIPLFLVIFFWLFFFMGFLFW